jgi:MFS family permease
MGHMTIGGGAEDQFSSPTYHHSQPNPEPRSEAHPDGQPGSGPKSSGDIARGVVGGAERVARGVVRRVVTASRADGAQESGLTALIWNQVLSFGADAMITVALAGTVFFGASADAQRGNVLLYLLITMAPFAVIAPVIGPILDRFSHGRRIAMAVTGFARAVLALVMSGHADSLLVLYPCALGSLVCSKAFSVLRAAAAPRLVPRALTQNQVNARLTIFGLSASLIFGGFVGVLIKVTSSYGFGLFVTALAFIVCGVMSIRLPRQVDSAPAVDPRSRPEDLGLPRPRTFARRLGRWAGRGFDDLLILALQGESALKLLSGMMTIFLAFYVQRTEHGLTAAWSLGLIAAAAGIGNFAGVAIGTRLRSGKPLRMISICCIAAAIACVIAAIGFSLWFIVLAMFVAAVANAVSKISIDSMIQSGVPESVRSSAFARSETFLQLAWVVGAALGVGLSAPHQTSGAFGFWFVGAIVGAVAIVIAIRSRAATRRAAG